MKFIFSIPTPKTCIECQFKDVHVSPGYGPLTVRCIINPELVIPARDAITGRYEKCPGILEENE